ncbi:protein phosphatase methylesterase 1 [Blastomyces dermatitidis ER-3]|uniref:Protein phosphatase methylesterase 1 n=3 Tax=Blastomyces TaxID=229219 RepID=A0A179UP56_BLAGS|nr:protein phosphatase methylesterase 1 [Blastomyces gilchristii SLH14081]XP_045279637.1 protein phosphatase methylesterase 1 [Blastomyces dermatitidis ER-3]EGE85864.2 protein phosphatase methylesterase 1 [Blastomyces dermatitidis ATCC 18188]EQL29375.1 protein phosphatase methylesterase 1 [Blastomyces dermatitidis ATCC 26199]OAS99909.1 protein phosphatase methylesterase 1 [Blastomyces dermatitidis ER-3]OAT08887.1 protein phosphatase methylesterase 1 [Blastomyces gilchristii SLH14081]
MSDLQKNFAKSRLTRLPPEVLVFDGLGEDRENDHDGSTTSIHHERQDDDSSSASSVSSTGTVIPSASQNLFARPPRSASARSEATPLPWIDFFDQELFLEEDIEGLHISHHAYISAPSESGPLFVTHHGAGSSGLSFAACAAEIKKILPTAGVLSLDARNHGSTSVRRKSQGAEDNSQVEIDLSLETLSRDLLFVIDQTRIKMNWESLPDVVFVGHSLGGAVVTEAAKKGELGSKLLAYAVLDVVEGSAMDGLQSMETYLSTRPSSFPSLASGISWYTRSRTIRNTLSARVSVPSLLREDPSDTSRPWKWRTDLAATKPFWENWFIGLSKKFLQARGGKLLLLAGTDRLDKELMIGQMQGKYQLQVFPESGHFIQEDQPAKTAQILVDFYKRNDRSALVLPPKVGDVLAAQAMAKGVGAGGHGGMGADSHQATGQMKRISA